MNKNCGKNKAKTMHSSSRRASLVWAFQVLSLSIFLSICFGFLSQSLLSHLGVIMAIIGICIFILISVIFDMLGIAVASADEEYFIKLAADNVLGGKTGLKLCQNSEKVCSLCADVVGDICSTLCGSAGACIVVALTSGFRNAHIIFFISTFTSALIAGLTIFFKALMKQKAITKANAIILKIGKFIEKHKKIDKNC